MSTDQRQLADVMETLSKTFACETRRFEALRSGGATALADLIAWSEARSHKVRAKAAKVHTPETTMLRNRPGTRKKKAVDPFWRQVAELVISYDIDPAYFVRAQFEEKSILQEPPLIFSLKTKKAVEVAGRLADSFEESYRFRHRSMQEELNNRTREYLVKFRSMDRSKILMAVLCNIDVSLDALTRHCCAEQFSRTYPQLKKAAKRFEIEAAIQYHRFSFIYDTVCGPDFISKVLKEKSEEIYNRVFQGE